MMWAARALITGLEIDHGSFHAAAKSAGHGLLGRMSDPTGFIWFVVTSWRDAGSGLMNSNQYADDFSGKTGLKVQRRREIFPRQP